MKTLFKNYIDAFNGLSKEVWWLALVTLINRAGTMVIPFLSIYLNEELCFSFKEIGFIMTAFGIGSVLGTWIGGRLTDKIGFYKVMIFSLMLSGVLFIAVQYLTSLLAFSIGIFILMTVADMFRPAMFVALSTYSKPENKTRSVTLIRLAINLGFSAGPVIGGVIIEALNYGGLFWVDGITCMVASVVLLNVLHPKKAVIQDDVIVENPESAYKDKPFIIFFFAMMFFSLVFFQYFSTLPIYYRQIHHLSEFEVGLLLGINGFLIFVFEMPLIKWLENSGYKIINLIIFGALLTGLSFLILIYTSWIGIIVIGMLLATLGEMIAFPLSNAFAIKRAKKGNQGEYMALYAMSFSVASIFGHNGGFHLVSDLGFNSTWVIMAGLSMLCILLLLILKHYINIKEGRKK